MADFTRDICTVIQAGGHSLTYGTNLYERRILPPSATVPKLACFVASTSGPPPIPYMHSSGESLYYPGAQVFVRGNPNTYDTTRTLCRAIMVTLQGTKPTGYVRVDIMQSEPTDLGEDDHNCPVFSFNIMGEIRQA